MRTNMLNFMRRSAAAVGGAAAAASLCAATSSEASSKRPRVLITGFHDWRELDGNIWRCRDNPSCRLLLGSQCPSPPIVRDGPLPRALRASVPADFSFVTLPVIWGTAAGLDLGSFDVVIHLGLGVYDRHDTILLENDAYNIRRGPDALAQAPPGHTLECGSAQVQPASSGMSARYSALQASASAPLAGDFVLALAPARSENSYICNETHWRALKAQHAQTGRLSSAYFVHLPYSKDDDHQALAAAVADVIRRIVALEV